MLYEGVLLFGIIMLAGLLYAGLFEQRHALRGQMGLQVFLVFVLGAYFVGFWVRGGQTLAMKTWHIRLIAADGQPLGAGRAAWRYLLCWLWFLPALGIAHLAGLNGAWEIFGLAVAGVAAYASLIWLHPTRQFWHDIASGTRLIDTRAQASAAAAKG